MNVILTGKVPAAVQPPPKIPVHSSPLANGLGFLWYFKIGNIVITNANILNVYNQSYKIKETA